MIIMEMTEMKEANKRFVREMVDFVPNVLKIQEYLKENFNVDTYFEPDTLRFDVIENSLNEAIDLGLAKDYIEKHLDTNCLDINYIRMT